MQVTFEVPDALGQQLQKIPPNLTVLALEQLVAERNMTQPNGETVDVTQDPVYQMEGYDSDVPADFSARVDDYLYGESSPQ